MVYCPSVVVFSNIGFKFKARANRSPFLFGSDMELQCSLDSRLKQGISLNYLEYLYGQQIARLS